MNKIQKKKKELTKWPKRRVLRRLGPISSSPPSVSLHVPLQHE